MKLSRYLPSLIRAQRLKSIPANHFHDDREETPVIVSLTSIPSRLPSLQYTIRSILHQKAPPREVVLWLNHALSNQIPASLAELQGRRFSIRFENHFSSHRKLAFSLRDFPENIIVTCDDDGMYPGGWLENLYRSHLKYPADIIGNAGRLIQTDTNGSLLNYKQWTYTTEANLSAPNLMSIGHGGVLYPPRSLHPDTTNFSLSLALTPKADDLWFKMMAHLAGTKHRLSLNTRNIVREVIGSQKDALKKSNITQDMNHAQWLALCSHYHQPPTLSC